jgi:hypothetical protein
MEESRQNKPEKAYKIENRVKYYSSNYWENICERFIYERKKKILKTNNKIEID